MEAPDPVVGVIFRRDAHPAARSLADLQDPEAASRFLCDDHLPLSEALRREWDEDAHAQCYSLLDEGGDAAHARVSKRSPLPGELERAGGEVRCSLLMLDLDLDGHREWVGTDEVALVLAGLSGRVPEPTWMYTTLHGARLVYVLSRPVPPARAEFLTEQVARALPEAFRASALACAEWTRLFRLPGARRADTGERFSGDPRFLLEGGGPELDPDSVPEGESGPASSMAEVVPYEGDRPGAATCRSLLLERGPDGKERPTALERQARRYLAGREAHAVVFGHGVVDVSAGWNDGLLRLVGQVVAMMARVEEASPEGCYALLADAVEQLAARDETGETNWEEAAWSMVCRMWAQERAKVDAEAAEAERSAREGAELLSRLAVVAAAAYPPGEVPGEAADAERWLSSRLVASDGTRHWVMRRDGHYNVRPVSTPMLLPMIRDLGMGDAIRTMEQRGRSWVPRSVGDVLAEHAIPVTRVRPSAREPLARVDGPEGSRVLHLPVHRLNPAVVPTWSRDVDEWLRELFGDRADLGLDWLSHALDARRPICALNLYGSPSSGKGMLVQGLAECFEGEHLNTGTELGQWSIGLIESPVVCCDEGIPRLDGHSSFDQAFRSLVTGGCVSVRGLYRDRFVADIYPRIVFTSNDRDITRGIVGGRDLTDDDARAIELRLLSIPVGERASRLLCSRGNYAYTRGWVHGQERGRYVVAGHVRWLYEHRKPSPNSTGRLLVEGEVSTAEVRDMRLQTEAAQEILRAVARMLESPQTRAGLHVASGSAWVTVSAVQEYLDSGLSSRPRLSMNRISQVLRQFSAQQLAPEVHLPLVRPPGASRGRWVEIDLEFVLEEASRYGMQCDRIERIILEGDNGHLKMARIRARERRT